MSEARPSWLRKGGGYLNEVDADLVGYAFEIGETTTIKRGKNKGQPFTPLSLTPAFAIDGDDSSKSDPKTQRLLIGNASQFGDVDDPTSIVSEDGLTLQRGPSGWGLGRGEAGTFMDSLIEAGFPAARFAESDTEINLEPMIGTRVRLKQVVNIEKTKNQGKQKGKDGREYDRKDLIVAAVHAVPNGNGSNGHGTGQGGVSKVAGKAVKGKPAVEEVDIEALSAKTLRNILRKQKDETIGVAKLSMAVLKAITDDDNREEVREFLGDAKNLAKIEGVAYNAKKMLLTLLDDAPDDN